MYSGRPNWFFFSSCGKPISVRGADSHFRASSDGVKWKNGIKKKKGIAAADARLRQKTHLRRPQEGWQSMYTSPSSSTRGGRVTSPKKQTRRTAVQRAGETPGCGCGGGGGTRDKTFFQFERGGPGQIQYLHKSIISSPRVCARVERSRVRRKARERHSSPGLLLLLLFFFMYIYDVFTGWLSSGFQFVFK